MYRETGISRMATWVAVPLLMVGATATTGCIGPLALVGLVAGCEALQPPEYSEDRVVLGGTAERAIFARAPHIGMTETLEGFDLSQPWTEWEEPPYEPQTEVVAVNLQTLESEVLLENVAADAYSLMTDGQRLAWFDYASEAVKAIDLDSGTESSYYPGLAGGRIHDIATIGNGYLVLRAGSAPYDTTALVVIDLETSEQLLITPAPLVEGYVGQERSVVVRDDLLAMLVWPSLEEESELEAETPPTSTIDIVDLTTEERSTLIADAGSEAVSLRFTDGRVLALSWPYDTSLVVRGYPLDGSAPGTLGQWELVETFERFMTPEAFNEHGVLIRTSETSLAPVFRMRDVLEFRAYDGTTLQIAEWTGGVLPLAGRLGTAALVENYVVYQPVGTFDYAVFDIETQSERRFDPFER